MASLGTAEPHYLNFAFISEKYHGKLNKWATDVIEGGGRDLCFVFEKCEVTSADLNGPTQATKYK